MKRMKRMKRVYTPLVVWRTGLKAALNAGRHDRRLQVALGLSLVFELAFGIWSVPRLQESIYQWQAAGPIALAMSLWMLCLSIWAATCFFAIIGALQALKQDRTLLLMTLPMQPATLFRASYGSLLLESLWNWLPLQALIPGYVLIPVLHWQALSWLLLIQVGCGTLVFLVQIAVLLCIRYLLPREQMKTRISLLCVLGGTVAALVFFAVKLITLGQWLVAWLRPEYLLVLYVLALIVGLGPLAPACGKLYSTTFTQMQGWDRSRIALIIPGTGLLKNTFARHRTLTGALFVRTVMNQSRNVITWLRIIPALILLPLFPVIHTFAARSGISKSMFAVAYVSMFTLLPILETAPNAISGEGNRFALYLTAPLTFRQILCAKLLLFLLPLLIEGLVGSFLLGMWFSLRMGQVGFASAATMLIIIGMMTLLVLGSSLDLDLNLSIEDSMQSFLQEEGPFSPRRMGLFSLSLLCFAAMLFLLWRLPALPALLALSVLDGAIVIGMVKMSNYILRNRLLHG